MNIRSHVKYFGIKLCLKVALFHSKFYPFLYPPLSMKITYTWFGGCYEREIFLSICCIKSLKGASLERCWIKRPCKEKNIHEKIKIFLKKNKCNMHILNTVYIYLLRMLCVPELLIQTATTEMHSILDCNIRKINGYFMIDDPYFSK